MATKNPGSTKLYKILKNGKSCHGEDMTWNLPTKYKLGTWHKMEGEVDFSQYGYHLTQNPLRLFDFGCTFYEAQADFRLPYEQNGDKLIVSRARLLKVKAFPPWLKLALRFISDLNKMSFGECQGTPLKAWDMTRGYTWLNATSVAMGKYGRSSETYEETSALRDKIQRAAPPDMFHVVDCKLWYVISEIMQKKFAKWNKEGMKVWPPNLVYPASIDATNTLYLKLLDTYLDPLTRKTIKDRWEVWKRGFALFGYHEKKVQALGILNVQ